MQHDEPFCISRIVDDRDLSADHHEAVHRLLPEFEEALTIFINLRLAARFDRRHLLGIQGRKRRVLPLPVGTAEQECIQRGEITTAGNSDWWDSYRHKQ